MTKNGVGGGWGEGGLSISFRKHYEKKKGNVSFISKMKILFARAIISSTQCAFSVFLSSF